MIIEIITAIIGAIGFPLYFWFIRYHTDALETVDLSSEPKKKPGLISWFFVSVAGGAIGWFVGKGLDKLWEVIVS